jgi:hypothetical protein
MAGDHRRQNLLLASQLHEVRRKLHSLRDFEELDDVARIELLFGVVYLGD